VVLQVATMIGVPMRPEQVQDLMRTLNVPKIARTSPDEDDRGEKRQVDRRRGLGSGVRGSRREATIHRRQFLKR
jgi:hypothetical protein